MIKTVYDIGFAPCRDEAQNLAEGEGWAYGLSQRANATLGWMNTPTTNHRWMITVETEDDGSEVIEASDEATVWMHFRDWLEANIYDESGHRRDLVEGYVR